MACVIGAALALYSLPLRAHDFWIEPASFAAEIGQTVELRLRVGEHLSGDAVPRQPGLFRQFVVADADGQRPVPGQRNADPAGAFRAARAGLQIVAYWSRPNRIELAADKFNAYLADEGLEHIAQQRARRGDSAAAARELYVRCAKSLVLGGELVPGQADRRLGLPLELVAERNPYAGAAGEPLPLRLTYEGQPLAGALVVAINSLRPFDKQAARSDAEGRVRFVLAPGGMWLVKAVHMVAAPGAPGPPGDSDDAQWLSWWASLTFESRDESAGAPVAH